MRLRSTDSPGTRGRPSVEHNIFVELYTLVKHAHVVRNRHFICVIRDSIYYANDQVQYAFAGVLLVSSWINFQGYVWQYAANLTQPLLYVYTADIQNTKIRKGNAHPFPP